MKKNLISVSSITTAEFVKSLLNVSEDMLWFAADPRFGSLLMASFDILHDAEGETLPRIYIFGLYHSVLISLPSSETACRELISQYKASCLDDLFKFLRAKSFSFQEADYNSVYSFFLKLLKVLNDWLDFSMLEPLSIAMGIAEQLCDYAVI